MPIGYAGLRSVTALEIAGPALGRMPGLWLRRNLCARHAAARHVVLRETASARVRRSFPHSGQRNTLCRRGLSPPCRRAACTTGRVPENRTDVDWTRDVGAGDTSSLPRARGATH